jgi:hypothetical protein
MKMNAEVIGAHCTRIGQRGAVVVEDTHGVTVKFPDGSVEVYGRSAVRIRAAWDNGATPADLAADLEKLSNEVSERLRAALL